MIIFLSHLEAKNEGIDYPVTLIRGRSSSRGVCVCVCVCVCVWCCLWEEAGDEASGRHYPPHPPAPSPSQLWSVEQKGPVAQGLTAGSPPTGPHGMQVGAAVFGGSFPVPSDGLVCSSAHARRPAPHPNFLSSPKIPCELGGWMYMNPPETVGSEPLFLPPVGLEKGRDVCGQPSPPLPPPRAAQGCGGLRARPLPWVCPRVTSNFSSSSIQGSTTECGNIIMPTEFIIRTTCCANMGTLGYQEQTTWATPHQGQGHRRGLHPGVGTP